MEHSGVALQEGDQGGGEGGQLLLVALCHLWHTHIVSWWPTHLCYKVTCARNMISSSRDSLNWSGVNSKTARVDLDDEVRVSFNLFKKLICLHSLEVSELLLKLLLIWLCIPLYQVLAKDRKPLEFKATEKTNLQLRKVIGQLVALPAWHLVSLDSNASTTSTALIWKAL